MPEQRHPDEGNEDPVLAEKRQSRPVPFYLSFLSIVEGTRSELHDGLLWLRGKTEPHGWRQIATCNALTDIPEQILEVYRVPNSNSLATALKELWRDRTYSELVSIFKSRQLELTYGLPYDPGVDGSSVLTEDDHRPYFLQESFILKADQQPRLFEALQTVRKAFYRKGWNLISASRSLSLPYRVMHLWRFGFGDQLAALMNELPQEPGYAELEDCCESRWQRLVQALPALRAGKWESLEAPTQ